MDGLGSSGANGRGLGNDRVDCWRVMKLLIHYLSVTEKQHVAANSMQPSL